MSSLMVKSSRLVTSGEYCCQLVVAAKLIRHHFSFRAPEALFQPAFLGLEAAGIHETT